MAEKRRNMREEGITPPISCLAELSDGTLLEGIVHDLSDAGARVSGNISSLRRGDHVRLVLVVQSDQKVVYEGEVKHVDPQGRFFGLAFTSGPKSMEADGFDGSRMMCCGREQNTPFCAYCGRVLSARQGATASKPGG